MDPQSRVRTGVERVRLVRSAASLNWPVAGRNALKIKVDQGCGCPAVGGDEGRVWLWLAEAFLLEPFTSVSSTLLTSQAQQLLYGGR